MWTYSTNFMGPAGLWWYERNNIPNEKIKVFSKIFNKEIEYTNYEQWCGGRIDCYCDNIEDKNYDHFGVEFGLPIMNTESFNKFSDWVIKFKSPELVDSDELFKLFEEETDFKIRFFVEGMYD